LPYSFPAACLPSVQRNWSLGFGLESDLEFEVAILAASAAFAFNFFLINGLSHNSFS
jgi:hypothetical protein